MTKAEIIKALDPFGDDQLVCVNLHSAAYPNGSQVIIQGVEAFPPWRGGAEDRSNWLIGINADADNSGPRILAAAALRAERNTSVCV